MDSIWTRERRAPARETLSQTQIVRAAIELLDSEGLAGLSMRKLAARLDSGATSLYWHVQTKDDLIELAIDEIYGEVDMPEPELAGWRAGATLFAHSLRAAIMRHAWLPEVVYTRPSLGPKAMSLGSRGRILFGAAGFAEPEVDYAMGSVMSYVIGAARRAGDMLHNEAFAFGLDALLDGLQAKVRS
jgi:AcrR family transcriptional regulator